MNCPRWEYTEHAEHARLEDRCADFLQRLRNGAFGFADLCCDTRPAHSDLFSPFVPKNFAYYAGNYRGSDYPCLKERGVFIRSDPRVGTKPAFVKKEIQSLNAYIRKGFDTLQHFADNPGKITPQQFLLRLVKLSCFVFVSFLKTHPYLNGNGHMGRLIVWAILGRFGFWPAAWPLNERPPDPPYSTLIKAYRDGDPAGLEKFVMKCLLG